MNVLMPESFAKRRHPRYPVVLSIDYRLIGPVPASAGVGRTRNVSEAGACLDLPETLPPKTPISLGLPTAQGELGMEAEVVWVGGPVSPCGGVPHGVAFVKVASEQHQALWALVNRKGQEWKTAVRIPVKLTVLCRPRGHAGPPLQGETGDLGRDGLSVRLAHRLPTATAVELTLPTPRGPRMVEASVVWLTPPEAQRPGEPIWHGLRFGDPGMADELTLGLLMAHVPDEITRQQEERSREK